MIEPSLSEGQVKAREVAVDDAPLTAILESLVRTVEVSQLSSSALGSILLLDADGKRLLHGAAPSLPAAYSAAIDGMAIGPAAGSCGTAAYTAETVVVSDIEADLRWAEWKSLAGEHGLRACWSAPIFSSQDKVLGTFALYHRTVSTPTKRDREIVGQASRTAALLIERELRSREFAATLARTRATSARQLALEVEAAHVRAEASEHSLKTFIDNLPELAWSAQPDGHIDYYNRRWYEYTGTTLAEMEGWGWEKIHDPQLVPKVLERWRHSLASGEAFEMEFTLRGKDGIARWFMTRVVPSRDASSKIVRWFGINTNIDEIKASLALAEAVVEQSRDTQRALLEMREAKERAEERVKQLEAEAGLQSGTR